MHDSIQQAIHDGRIVVGVDARGDNAAARLAEARRIPDSAGGKQPQPLWGSPCPVASPDERLPPRARTRLDPN